MRFPIPGRLTRGLLHIKLIHSNNAAEALKAVQEAFCKGRCFLDPHVLLRMKQRSYLPRHQGRGHEAKRAEPYGDPKRQLPPGTSSWRIFGFDFDGGPLNLGVDLAVDHLGSFAVVITVF